MTYPFENKQLTKDIKINTLFQIEKMEDLYLLVRFKYKKMIWNGAIPIRAKYQGVNIPLTSEDVEEWVKECYAELSPEKYILWQEEQNNYWKNKSSEDTQLVFEALNGTESTTKWLCRKCGPVPQVNPQPGARIRSLRQMGYHIATLNMQCSSCGKKTVF